MNTNSSTEVRYLGYLRKSSEGTERQALSIPAQKEKLVEMFPGLDIEWVEEARSAFHPDNRPAFTAMLDRIGQGGRTGLVVWHPDRLSRNETDAGRITYMVRSGVIKDIKFGTYHFENSPEGIWMLQMALCQSQYESAKKGRDVKRGLEKKAKMGCPSGVAKIGFINDRRGEKGSRRWGIDTKRYPLVRQLLHAFLTGRYSIAQLWRMATQDMKLTTFPRKREGGRLITLTHMGTILGDPIYAGFFEYDGKRYELDERLPRMITESQYWHIQAILGRRGRPRPKQHEAVYSQFMWDVLHNCAVVADHKHQLICSTCRKKFSYLNRDSCPRCGEDIDGMNDPTYLKYTYYYSSVEKKRSDIRARGIEERKVDTLVRSYITENLLIHPDITTWCANHVDEVRNRESQERRERRDHIVAQQEDRKSQLAELIRMRTRGVITDAELLAVKPEYEMAIKTDLDAENEADWAEVERIFTIPQTILDEIDSGSVDRKKKILAEIGSNLTLVRGKLSISMREPISMLIDGLKRAAIETPRFEPKRNLGNKGQKGDFSPSNPTLLRVVLDVRNSVKKERLRRVQEGKRCFNKSKLRKEILNQH